MIKPRLFNQFFALVAFALIAMSSFAHDVTQSLPTAYDLAIATDSPPKVLSAFSSDRAASIYYAIETLPPDIASIVEPADFKPAGFDTGVPRLAVNGWLFGAGRNQTQPSPEVGWQT